MYYFVIVTFIFFIVLTIIGYRKNNRNLMLSASICLVIGLAGPEFITGFQEGLNNTIEKTK